MSILSSIWSRVKHPFGGSAKDVAVKAAENIVESHVSEGAIILQKFLATKGVNLETEVLAEGVSLILKGGESLLSGGK